MADTQALERLNSEFQRCRAMLESALVAIPSTHTLEDVREACEEGRMQLWPGERAVLLTEVFQFPRRKGCFVRAMGGDPAESSRLGKHVTAWAKANGCDLIMALGRPQWMRDMGDDRVSTLSIRDL